MGNPQIAEFKLNPKEWSSHTLKTLAPLARGAEPESAPPVARLQLNDASGVLLRHVGAIEELFLAREIKRRYFPWASSLKWSDQVNLITSVGQRARPLASPQVQMQLVNPKRFYDRWARWIIEDMRSYGEQGLELYDFFRATSLSLVARTLSVHLEGEAIAPVADALERLDLSVARIMFSGKGNRPAWFPGSDHKLAATAMHDLEAVVRPLVRKRIGGVVEEDDLMTLWVNTEGEDGKLATEDHVISESISLLVMAYTALPKVLFGAACEVNAPAQEELRARLNKEFRVAVTAMQAGEDGGAPNLRQESARQALPVHSLVVNEAERLYPPVWLAPIGLESAGRIGPIELKEGEQVWLSPWALHREPRRFKDPERFWPNRWSGQLEAQLPRYAFAPYGFEGRARLSEQYCRELTARILMVFFAQFKVQVTDESAAPQDWSLSLCLKPSHSVSWGFKNAPEGQKPGGSQKTPIWSQQTPVPTK